MLKLHLKVEGGSLSSGPRSFSVFLQLQRWTGGTKAAKQPRGQLMTNSCGGRTTGHSLADCWTILRLFYVFYVISWLTFCSLTVQFIQKKECCPSCSVLSLCALCTCITHPHLLPSVRGFLELYLLKRRMKYLHMRKQKVTLTQTSSWAGWTNTCTWSMCRSNWV